MKKRISVIGIRGYPAGFPGSGGIDYYFESQLPQIVKDYRKIILFVRSWVKGSPLKSSASLRIISIPTFNTQYLDTPIYAFLATLIASFSKTDIVWFHAPGSALFCFLPKLFGKKIYLTHHGLDWQREKWGPLAQKILKIAESVSVALADKIYVVSEDLGQYINFTYGKTAILSLAKIEAVQKLKPGQITEKYGLFKDKYLLYLGRLVPEKRVEWIIDAFLNPPDIYRKYKLVIAGELKKDRYCKQLLAKAQNRKNIIFTGYVKGRVKSELFTNCRLFILPSSLEGYSLALAEAISYKKESLVSDIQVNRSLSASSSLVYTFNRNSFADFNSKLRKILT